MRLSAAKKAGSGPRTQVASTAVTAITCLYVVRQLICGIGLSSVTIVRRSRRHERTTLLEITAAAYQEEDIGDAKVAHVEATRALMLAARTQDVFSSRPPELYVSEDLLPDEEG
jgi:hypothetical protein